MDPPDLSAPVHPVPPARGTRAASGRPANARTHLLDAAMTLIRSKGYAATTVDELCAAAGVTKGAFFHHFPTKESLGVAAAGHWSTSTRALFDAAAFHDAADPLGRVLAYLDLRLALIDGPVEAFTCVAGTMAQETFLSSPAIRDACGASIVDHAGMLEADIAAAIVAHGVAGVDARGLALHAQAVIQGAFVLAKATADAGLARDSIRHLRRYFELLFGAASSAAAADAATSSETTTDTPTGRTACPT